MPIRYHIAAVGGGVAGLVSAWALKHASHEVTLFDPHPRKLPQPSDKAARPNASAMAGGMLAPLSEIDYLPQTHMAAAMEGQRLWRDILRDLSHEHLYIQNGSLILAHPQDVHLLRRLTDRLQNNHAAWRRAGQAEIAALEPDASPFQNGLFMPLEAHVNPHDAMNLLRENIDRFEQDEADPQTLSACYDWVIDARGMGAAQDDPDLRGVKGEALIVENREFSLQRPVRLMHPRYPLYIVPRPDHHFMIGASVVESADNAQPSLRSAMELMSAAFTLHPSFGESRIVDLYAGIRPAYPENLPRVTRQGNILRINGFFRHGFLFSPVIAGCIMALIEQTSDPFLSLFLKERHGDFSERPAGFAQRRT